MLTLEIVTPAGRAYMGDVEMVTLPAANGQIGVRPRHTPLLTRIEPGEIVVRTSGQAGDRDEVLAVGEGLVAITADRVSIVTDMAIKSSDIDEAKVEDARQRALARLADKISDEEVATVNASLARAVAQLHVKKRRRR
jgi:F-type H+-transporting ATPase subunit epsilon